MWTDTHCHILSSEYVFPENIINNLKSDNIKRIIINGYDNKSNKEILNLIQNKNVYGALGIHPDNLNEIIDYNFIEENITNSKIIAVGEIGLDYFHNKENKECQIELLEYFLNLAEKYHKPVIIHCRDAHYDLINVLKKHQVRGIIHCFSGSLEIANEYIKLGFKLGIGGVLTFKNTNLRDTLKKLSINNILIETDSPYLTPSPYRGLPNEPYYLNVIAGELCNIYNISREDLSQKLEINLHEIFDF